LATEVNDSSSISSPTSFFHPAHLSHLNIYQYSHGSKSGIFSNQLSNFSIKLFIALILSGDKSLFKIHLI
jgi:hypothetical protein